MKLIAVRYEAPTPCGPALTNVAVNRGNVDYFEEDLHGNCVIHFKEGNVLKTASRYAEVVTEVDTCFFR